MELIFYGLLGSVIALIGGLFVLWREAEVKRIMTSLLAFAAAAFLGVSFLDLLPEAIEDVHNPVTVFVAFLCGVFFFLVLERTLMKYSNKHNPEAHGTHDDHTETLPALIILGDTLHNFLDGIAIAIAFVANPAIGLTTALAVAAHEVPQEIGDFAILLDRGWSKAKVFLVNFYSALGTLVGLALGYYAASSFTQIMPYLLAGVAGIFSYIALSDLIPEIHHRARHRHLYRVILPFGVGLIVIWFLISSTH